MPSMKLVLLFQLRAIQIIQLFFTCVRETCSSLENADTGEEMSVLAKIKFLFGKTIDIISELFRFIEGYVNMSIKDRSRLIQTKRKKNKMRQKKIKKRAKTRKESDRELGNKNNDDAVIPDIYNMLFRLVNSF